MDIHVLSTSFLHFGFICLALLWGGETSDGDWLLTLFGTETTLEDAIFSGWLLAISRLMLLDRFSPGRSLSRDA
jgi:hypothetical protein